MPYHITSHIIYYHISFLNYVSYDYISSLNTISSIDPLLREEQMALPHGLRGEVRGLHEPPALGALRRQQLHGLAVAALSALAEELQGARDVAKPLLMKTQVETSSQRLLEGSFYRQDPLLTHDFIMMSL